MTAEKVFFFAHAKVNLRLEVLGKREDNYHLLQMVNADLELHDDLEIERTEGGIEMSCDNRLTPTGPKNLVWQAVEAVLERVGASGGVRIKLVKRIPVSAGLGGGSSDAAAALVGMNRLLGSPLADGDLMEMGLRLGADVPYFLHGGPAIVRGIGEIISAYSITTRASLVLVNPGFPVSARFAYESLGMSLTERREASNLPPSLTDPVRVSEILRNDLEGPVIAAHPRIAEMKDALAWAGSLGVLMSGSGPTAFGVFATPEEAERASRAVARPGWRVIATRLKIE